MPRSFVEKILKILLPDRGKKKSKKKIKMETEAETKSAVVDTVRPADWNDLHWAVWCGDLDRVKEICRDPENITIVNSPDQRGWTALHLACTSKDSDIWKSQQIEPEGRGPNPRNAALTSRPGADERYRLFTYSSSRYTQDAPDHAECTISFMMALELLQAGAQITFSGVSPVHCAFSSNWPEIVDALFHYGAVPDNNTHFGNFKRARTGLNQDYRPVYEYCKKKLGPDAWERFSGSNFVWPSPDFQYWLFSKIVPNASRSCLPASRRNITLDNIDDSSLCSLCKAIDLQTLRSPSGYVHASSLHDLQDEAQTCPLCNFLYGFLSHRLCFMLRTDVSQIVLRLDLESLAWGKIPVLKLQLTSGCYCYVFQHQTTQARSRDFSTCVGKCRGMLMEDITLDFFTSDRDSDHKLLFGQYPAEDSTSAAALLTMRNWFNTCEEKHEACRKRKSSVLPTRVIDVRKFETLGTVRLVLGIDNRGGYTALSHRWCQGEPPAWITTVENEELRRNRDFEANILPKTIQDAIKVTAWLGIPFLWVDSLCIIQKCEAEWRIESGKMIDVFGKASLTLFTEEAVDDDYSFLGPRQTTEDFQQRKGCSLSLNDGSGSKIEVQALQRYSRYRRGNPAKATDLFASDVIHSHLSNRGWIFQEQVISPRRLHFGHHQMFWVCETVYQAEDGTDIKQSAPDWMHFLYNSRARAPPPGIPRDARAEIDVANHRIWARLAENYSRRGLTIPTDKFAAIGALAKHFGNTIQSPYIAGCWTHFFRLCLIWVARPTCPPNEENKKKSRENSAALSTIPSWSWLAADGAIEYPHTNAGFTTRTNETGIIHIYFQEWRLPVPSYATTDAFYTTAPNGCTPYQIEGCLRPGFLRPNELNEKDAPPWYQNSASSVVYNYKIYSEDNLDIGFMIPDRVGEALPSEVRLLKTWTCEGICPCCTLPKTRFISFIVLERKAHEHNGYRYANNVYRRIGAGWRNPRHQDGQASVDGKRWTEWDDKNRERLMIW